MDMNDKTLRGYIERDRLEAEAIDGAMSRPYSKDRMYRTQAIMDESGSQVGEVQSAPRFDTSYGTLTLVDDYNIGSIRGPYSNPLERIMA